MSESAPFGFDVLHPLSWPRCVAPTPCSLSAAGASCAPRLHALLLLCVAAAFCATSHSTSLWHTLTSESTSGLSIARPSPSTAPKAIARSRPRRPPPSALHILSIIGMASVIPARGRVPQLARRHEHGSGRQQAAADDEASGLAGGAGGALLLAGGAEQATSEVGRASTCAARTDDDDVITKAGFDDGAYHNKHYGQRRAEVEAATERYHRPQSEAAHLAAAPQRRRLCQESCCLLPGNSSRSPSCAGHRDRCGERCRLISDGQIQAAPAQHVTRGSAAVPVHRRS